MQPRLRKPSYVGLRVLKHFEGYPEPFPGVVDKFLPKSGFYHIAYDDGDSEEMMEEDVEDVLVNAFEDEAIVQDDNQVIVNLNVGDEAGNLVGMKVSMQQKGKPGPITGQISSYFPATMMYRVFFSNGTCVDMNEEEVKEHLCVENQKPSSNGKRLTDTKAKNAARKLDALPDMYRDLYQGQEIDIEVDADADADESDNGEVTPRVNRSKSKAQGKKRSRSSDAINGIDKSAANLEKNSKKVKTSNQNVLTKAVSSPRKEMREPPNAPPKKFETRFSAYDNIRKVLVAILSQDTVKDASTDEQIMYLKNPDFPVRKE